MKVIFNDVQEFCREMTLNAGIIECGIVRVTRRFETSTHMPLRHVSVVATYVANGQLFELRRYCGEVIGFGPGDGNTEQRAEDAAKTVEAAAEALGLSCRAGLIQEQA